MAQFLKAYPEAHEVQVANARLLASEKRYEPALVAFEQVVKQAHYLLHQHFQEKEKAGLHQI